MKTISKALAGTVAAGAMAMTSTPAFANDYREKRGVDAGDIIAGAVILGGIAAVASAVGKKDRYRDRGYYGNNHYRGDRYNRGNYHRSNYNARRGNPRRAVERCIRTAERQARRFGGFRYADVTDIRDVDRTRYGFRVKGRIVVEGGRGYGRGYSDRGKFTCFVQGGNRPQVNFRKIRGLR
ncbi:hypothetical protein ACRAQ7_11220 [Erythrobacter sp. W53]|uniref:hypothetical protein n=1 Tax=Erythrobacter sp. W53 TaxID=3425947 RepID=UPI003D7674E8